MLAHSLGGTLSIRSGPRLAVAAAAAAAVALLATACAGGSAGSPSGATTISYFTYSAAPSHLGDLAKVVAAFEKANPGIKVDVSSADYADYFTKLSTEIAAGTAPDTFEVDYQDFVNYASSGALLDLGSGSGQSSSFDAAAYTPTSVQAFKYSGKQMALPESFSDVLLFYNEKLFNQAHIPYPTASWTWADEMAAAKKLTSKAAGVWGLFQPVSFYEFYKALAQAGGQFFNPARTKATFNSPAGVAAAQWLLSKPGTTMPTLAQIGSTPNFDTNLFTSGKLAMWINGNWQFTGLQHAPFGWNVIVEPGDAAKASAVFLNGVAVSRETQHAAAAEKWISFLSSSQVSVKTRVNSAWELPPVSDTSLEASYLTATPPANRQAVFSALTAPSYAPIIPQENQMTDDINNALTNAAEGRMSVQAALNQAAAQVTALLQK
jgi:multiple sugar transport system substrate-binding protein